MPKFIDLTGRKFGRLTVIERSENIGKKTMWLCECDCGNKKATPGGDLNSGRVQSCGCLRKDLVAKKNYLHGLADGRLHSIWRGIKKRCYNPKSKSYKDYGGRGIEMCEEWLNSFTEFYNWAMVNGYSDDLSIDRANNDGNYEPSNCRWTNRTQQNINQRIRKDNQSKVKGVYYDKTAQKYRATIGIAGKQFNLGIFDTLEEAAKARKKAEEQHYKNN